MNWNLEGKRINGLYMGLFPVQGKVTLSRVQYGGTVSHHMDLEEPIKVYGAVRDRIILEHKFVNRIVDDNEDDGYDWELDRGQNFAAGY